MITTLSLNPSIACYDEQFDFLVAQFEELNETLAEDMDQNWTPEQIDAHEPLSDFCSDYHDEDTDFGWFTEQPTTFLYALEMICLIVEKCPVDQHTIKKAWYTDNWEDVESFAQSF